MHNSIYNDVIKNRTASFLEPPLVRLPPLPSSPSEQNCASPHGLADNLCGGHEIGHEEDPEDAGEPLEGGLAPVVALVGQRGERLGADLAAREETAHSHAAQLRGGGRGAERRGCCVKLGPQPVVVSPARPQLTSSLNTVGSTLGLPYRLAPRAPQLTSTAPSTVLLRPDAALFAAASLGLGGMAGVRGY